MCSGKTIVLGVSSSIAAYKAAGLTSTLHKMGVEVHVILTQNATRFIGPAVFEQLSGQACITDTFERSTTFEVEHISLAKKADVFLVAPATANVIGKIAAGICDDMLTTTICATKAPKVIVPAMNTSMYENPITQRNMAELYRLGYHFVEPGEGMLACGDVGKGRFPEEQVILDCLETLLNDAHDLKGKRVLVSAGATEEAMDPVRFLTNHSTGKMGLALAKSARYRGGEVTLVLGNNQLNGEDLAGLSVVRVRSALEMQREMERLFPRADFVAMSAAVSDYRPAVKAAHKIKKADERIMVEFIQNPDIIAALSGKRKPHQKICAFAMETENLLEHAIKKRREKEVDLVVANHLFEEGAGFGTDTNRVTLVTAAGHRELPLLQKREVADAIWDEMLALEQGNSYA